MDRIAMLTQFMSERPEDPFPRYGLAIELKNTGRLEEADRAFTELIDRFPDYTAAYLHAGGVLASLGRRDDAARTYRAGIEACGKKRPPDGHALGELQAALASLEHPEEDDQPPT
jgi:tetratricopeptide (TPR) repeat protein